MIVMACLDDREGMLFNKRRQSKDRAVRERMLETIGENRLWMNGYSAKQFEQDERICVDERFLENCADGEFCFVENTDISPMEEKIESLILYRWNRHYPSDVRFPLDLEQWTLTESTDFAGNSHETITEERYTR